MIKRLLSLTVALILCTGLSAHALLLDLNPFGGAISGTPGSTIGWGYSITNDSASDWVVISGSSFTTAATWGTYDDYFLTNFLMLAPSESFSQVFSEVLTEGLGSFTIDPLALAGWTAIGTIDLTYDLYDGDPMDTGNWLSSATAYADASVTVSGGAPAVPEPGTILLVGSGLAGLLGMRRRSARQSMVNT